MTRKAKAIAGVGCGVILVLTFAVPAFLKYIRKSGGGPCHDMDISRIAYVVPVKGSGRFRVSLKLKPDTDYPVKIQSWDPRGCPGRKAEVMVKQMTKGSADAGEEAH